MFFKQFYLGCLAHASYLIGSAGEAAVVDPQRDVEQYIEEAKKQGLEIKYIIETHLHADFVSGHKELAALTGAEIVFGRKAEALFDHRAVKDNDVIKVGDLDLTFLETPGHTPESICILVKDRSNAKDPGKLLTGDTLFIGDVGRPDLVGALGHSQEEMAALLYDSLFEKVLRLPDETEVYPAHGAGSLCGKNLSTERSSTIGVQKKFNCALKVSSKEEFIEQLCQNQPEAPRYFSDAVRLNKQGAASLDELKEPEKLNCDQVKEKMASGAWLVDTRPPALFGDAFVPGSLNIALGGQFASWTGTLIPVGDEIVLIAENAEAVKEAVIRLARAGHEKVSGYLDGGISAWKKAGCQCGQIKQVTVHDLKQMVAENDELQLIDVRRLPEYRDAHVPGTLNLPLCDLENNLARVDKNRPTAIICRSGYRSSIASGILSKAGLEKLYNVVGGTSAWVDAGFEVEQESTASCAQ